MVDALILKVAILVGARTRSELTPSRLFLINEFLMLLIRWDFPLPVVPYMTMYRGCEAQLAK